MIIYREQRRTISTAKLIASLESLQVRDRDSLREALIDFGQLESGVADAIPPNHPANAELRRVAVNLGRIFFRRALKLDLTVRADLPAQIEIGTPEGYAYYGLFPESYVECAERFVRDENPRHCIVIGVRNIGSSLSAVVAGALTELGADVDSFTVRPAGHPFDRSVDLCRAINPDAIHLLVDEGPGLSGSSLACVADALSRAGVPDSRIVFVPSWKPDPETLLSSLARDRFLRHRSIVPVFDPRLVCPELALWRDFSAGKWRDLLCPGDYPAVQPQHERRKLLRPDPPYILAKFAGFGSRGRRAFERSRALFDAGFSPAPLAFSNGFLFSGFIPGRPVTHTTEALARRIADYLNHVAQSFPAKAVVPWNSLAEMITTNLAEALDFDASPILAMRRFIEDAPAYELDARMLPHEWIETASGYLKTDAVDHFDDHFFPGPQDIAWDVAAAMIEFSLSDAFLDRFDASVRKRVPFYRLAYSAFRLGYCRLAERNVGPEDASRFRALARRYETVTRESPLLHHLV
jgi:hypothetical protein